VSEPLRIVVIGPESTGKTWLVRALAEHYGVPSSPEHAREYVEEHGAQLSFADVDPIGRGQQVGEDRMLARASARSSWIEPAARERLADLYLLLDVDVPWVPDGPQREQPARRAELFESFRATLERFGARVVHISGSWQERERCAREAIDRFP